MLKIQKKKNDWNVRDYTLKYLAKREVIRKKIFQDQRWQGWHIKQPKHLLSSLGSSEGET